MTGRGRPGRLELPIDPADATGAFGLFSAVLSLGVPYFVGLTATLSALGLAVALPRMVAGRDARGPTAIPGRWVYLAAAAALAGWGGFALASWLYPAIRGLLLGIGGVPLWWTTRRPIPFGGG